MTQQEFLKTNPQYKDARPDEIWSAMEDSALNSDNHWVADYSGGFTEIKLNDHVIFNQNNFWINEKTKERISNEEFEKRYRTEKIKGLPVESFRIDFIDFGKNE